MINIPTQFGEHLKWESSSDVAYGFIDPNWDHNDKEDLNFVQEVNSALHNCYGDM
jgi:hypothetical protein|tara:strand:- start:6921 stop:7085 length:165 start_codon:yes stop_codon:yes gene_type:complete